MTNHPLMTFFFIKRTLAVPRVLADADVDAEAESIIIALTV